MAENPTFSSDEVGTDGRTNEAHPEGGDVSDIRAEEKDVAVTIGSPGPYAGMPKEVLLQYSRRCGYVWARDILTGIVVLTILILFSLVVTVIVISPSCLEFWQTSPIYEIYPKSFRRSNDENGYGDIKGITEKFSYLSGLGVNVVSVNSLYESSDVDNDYEITDFKNIDPVYGTMADMENLIANAHDEGMKLVVDFIPNHSSVKHPWFLASSNTSHPDYLKYKDYYVWVNGNGLNDLPNNWMSMGDGGLNPAWTWNGDRGQFYYHAFSGSQPDFNLRNAAVRKELQDILRFWLEKGVDGFRAIATSYMLEATHMRDNPVINATEMLSANNLYPDFTKHYKGIHDIVVEWRQILDEYSTEPGVYRFLEIHDEGAVATMARYYGTDIAYEASFPLNNVLFRATPEEWNAQNLEKQIWSWMTSIPKGRWPSWSIGQQQYSRVSTRIGKDKSLLGMVLSMTLPGTPTVYYGDELGMVDNGDNLAGSSRSLMLWNTEHANGFCGNCTPWNGQNLHNSSGATVQGQNGDPDSMLSNYKRLISLRNEMVFQRGYLCMIGNLGGTLAFVRELDGLKSMLILLNFDESTLSSVDLSDTITGSGNVDAVIGSGHTIDVGGQINFNDVKIPPVAGYIISYDVGDSLLSKSPAMERKCLVHTELCYNSGLQILQHC